MDSVRDLEKIKSDLFDKQAEKIVKSLVISTIRSLQQIRDDCLLSGYDSGLLNVWDEYCTQIQGDNSFDFRLYEDIAFNTCAEKLEKLRIREIDKYKLLIVFVEQNSLKDEDVVNYIMSKINNKALNYTNSRIREYFNNAE